MVTCCKMVQSVTGTSTTSQTRHKQTHQVYFFVYRVLVPSSETKTTGFCVFLWFYRIERVKSMWAQTSGSEDDRVGR